MGIMEIFRLGMDSQVSALTRVWTHKSVLPCGRTHKSMLLPRCGLTNQCSCLCSRGRVS